MSSASEINIGNNNNIIIIIITVMININININNIGTNNIAMKRCSLIKTHTDEVIITLQVFGVKIIFQ